MQEGKDSNKPLGTSGVNACHLDGAVVFLACVFAWRCLIHVACLSDWLYRWCVLPSFAACTREVVVRSMPDNSPVNDWVSVSAGRESHQPLDEIPHGSLHAGSSLSTPRSAPTSRTGPIRQLGRLPVGQPAGQAASLPGRTAS